MTINTSALAYVPDNMEDRVTKDVAGEEMVQEDPDAKVKVREVRAPKAMGRAVLAVCRDDVFCCHNNYHIDMT